MRQTGTFAAFRRYFPGLFVLLLAIGLGIRVSDQPPAREARKSIAESNVSSGPRSFKSRDRSATASVFPQFRKSITITGADDLRITPDEARIEKLEAFKRESGEGRAKDVATLIRRLCRSGFADEAFQLIPKESSLERSAGIAASFVAAKWDDTAIFEKIRELGTEDRQTAWVAYLKRVPSSELGALLSHTGDLEDSFRLALDPLIREKFLSLTERASILPHIDDLHRAGLVSDSILAWKILETPGGDPFSKWKDLKNAVPGKVTLDREMQAYFLRRMTDADPAQITKQLVQSSPPAIANYHLRHSFSVWLKKDAPNAEKWFTEKEKTLSSNQHDDVAWSFAQHFKDLRQPEETRSWLGKIRDPETQANLKRMLGDSIVGQTGN